MIKLLFSVIPLILWMPFILNAAIVDSKAGLKIQSQGIQFESHAGLEEVDDINERIDSVSFNAIELCPVDSIHKTDLKSFVPIQWEFTLSIVLQWYHQLPRSQSPPGFFC